MPYRTEKAVETMREVFNRRQRDWTETDEKMHQFAMETAISVELDQGTAAESPA
jgi:hypothetical protein